MTRATNQPARSLTLGPAEAAPIQLANLPPQVANLPPQVAVPPPPAVNANAAQPVNDQHAASQPASGPAPVAVPPAQPASGQAPEVVPPAPAPSAAQNLTTQLLTVDPTMTLDQLTGILNILAPNRHLRSVASNLLRSSQPVPPHRPAAGNGPGPAQAVSQPPNPAAASAPNPAPLNPLTGPQITIPQRREQPQSQGTSLQDLLDALGSLSRKRYDGLPRHIFLSSHYLL